MSAALLTELQSDLQQLRKKQAATLTALLALRGLEALELADGGFVVLKWKLDASNEVGLVAHRCADVQALEDFARQAGAVSAA